MTLSNGESIPADLVVLGTGMQPNVDFVGKLKLSQSNGGIECNPFLETSEKDVFAAGDVASFPYFYTGEQIRNGNLGLINGRAL